MPRGSRARPLWSYAIPFSGPPAALSPHQWRLLGVLGATVLINHYDFGLLSLVLSHLQRDLAISEARAGPMVGIIRLGAAPALPLALLADRVGRRRLLLATILGFTACTVATAFARNATQFMWLQFLGRTFVTAEELVAIVVLAEELPARSRGYALGMLAALGTLGNGLSAAAFAFIDVLPYGWRALYLFGAAPLLLLAWIRRTIPETRRFERQRDARAAARGEGESGLRSLLRPGVELARRYPRRLLAMVGAMLPATLVMTAANTFVPKTLQEEHGFAPDDVTLLYLTAGIVVLVGNVAAGRLADAVGRRRVLAGAVALNAGGIAAFYNLAMPSVVAAWVVMMFCFVAVDVLFGVLGSELFPTAYRSTASSVRALAWTLGGSLGLALEGALLGVLGDSHAEVITAMLAVAWIPPLLLFWAIPETAARELEEIAPD